jgi:transcriptional regulator, AsnC family
LVFAYVLINAEVGYEDSVLAEAKKVPEVKTAHLVYGVYDIVLLLEAPNVEMLKDVITKKIRKIPNVRSTLTMMVVK